MSARLLALILLLSGCASTENQIVMLNPKTGATVGCPVPSPEQRSAGFLIASTCLSACRLHGFRLTDSTRSADARDSLPQQCTF